MAVLMNTKIYYDGYDISCDSNQVKMEVTVDMQDCTAFGDTSKANEAGLPNTDISINGFMNHLSATSTPNNYGVSDLVWAKNASTSGVFVIIPTCGANGQPAYYSDAIEAKFNFGGKVSEMYTFQADLKGAGNIYRGQVVDISAYSTDSLSTGHQLVACATGKLAYAAVVIGPSTMTALVTIQSANEPTFASETTQFTFTVSTGAPRAQMLSSGVNPGSTDPLFWRTKIDVTGSSTSSVNVLALVGFA